MRHALPLAALIAMSLAGPALARPELPIDIATVEAESQQRFETADANGDGELTVAEFTAGLETLERDPRSHRFGPGGGHPRSSDPRPEAPDGPPPADAPKDAASREAWRPEIRAEIRAEIDAKIFAAMDADGNGELSAAESSEENRAAARRKVMVESMFERFDADASGTLSAAEMPNRGAHLRELDSDGDGLVTGSELKAGRYRFAPKG